MLSSLFIDIIAPLVPVQPVVPNSKSPFEIILYLSLTLILQLAEYSPTFAVIVASPIPIAVTFPFSSTVATFSLFDVQIISVFEESSPKTFAVSFKLLSITITASLLSNFSHSLEFSE